MNKNQSTPKEVTELYHALKANALLASLDPHLFAYVGYYPEHEEWIVGPNVEYGDGSYVFRNNTWHFRDRYNGHDTPLKHGHAEAMAEVNIFYTG